MRMPIEFQTFGQSVFLDFESIWIPHLSANPHSNPQHNVWPIPIFVGRQHAPIRSTIRVHAVCCLRRENTSLSSDALILPTINLLPDMRRAHRASALGERSRLGGEPSSAVCTYLATLGRRAHRRLGRDHLRDAVEPLRELPKVGASSCNSSHAACAGALGNALGTRRRRMPPLRRVHANGTDHGEA